MTADVVVIGAGIAGASAAFELSAERRTLLIERECQPGYHSTGRSAAIFAETYGSPVVRILTEASRAALTEPDPEFVDQPLLQRRGLLYVARHEQADDLLALAATIRRGESAQLIHEAEVQALVPVLRSGLAGGLYEPKASDIDVHTLQSAYLRGFKRRGGTLLTGADVLALNRKGELWHGETTRGTFEAGTIVNAAGAWADGVALLAGARPLPLQVTRRTAILVDGPKESFAGWPFTVEIKERLYFRPETGRLLVSPGDETPVLPYDAQPEEWDVAVAVDRLQEMTSLCVSRVHARWAGLRTFTPDRGPVAGYDTEAENFLWLAGQGGFGIQTAPALAEIVRALSCNQSMPAHLAAGGLKMEDLAKDRFAGFASTVAQASGA